MHNVLLLKNLINQFEKNELANWIYLNKDSAFFKEASHPGTIRKTTRFSEDVPYPFLSFVLKHRIINQLGISDYIDPPYPYGMIASFGTLGDRCEQHTDPVWFNNYCTLHCVVMLSSPESSYPIINNVKYSSFSCCDGLFYPVSFYKHGTTTLEGIVPRLLWIFGFCVKDEYVSRLFDNR